MASVTFPPELGGDGSTVTDDNNPTTGLGNGGHRVRFVPALQQTVQMALTSKEQAAVSQQYAAAALTAPGTIATSTTGMTVGVGARSLTVQTGKLFIPGQFVTIASTASPGNVMLAQVVSYNSGTGSMDVDSMYTRGSGTFADWQVGLTGPAADIAELPIFSAAAAVNKSISNREQIVFNGGERSTSNSGGQVCLVGGVFICGASSAAEVYTSTDGASWTARTMPNSQSWVVGQNPNASKAVAAGSTSVKVAVSTNGTTWTGVTDLAGNASGHIPEILDNGDMLISGASTTVYYSTNGGSTWTSGTTPTTKTGTLPAIGGLFNFFNTTELYTSATGATSSWTLRATPAGVSPPSIQVDPFSGKWIGVGTGGIIWETSDCINWTDTGRVSPDGSEPSFVSPDGVTFFATGNAFDDIGTYHNGELVFRSGAPGMPSVSFAGVGRRCAYNSANGRLLAGTTTNTVYMVVTAAGPTGIFKTTPTTFLQGGAVPNGDGSIDFYDNSGNIALTVRRNGSANSPNLALGSDSGTGFYTSASNRVDVTLGGVQSLSLLPSQLRIGDVTYGPPSGCYVNNSDSTAASALATAGASPLGAAAIAIRNPSGGEGTFAALHLIPVSGVGTQLFTLAARSTSSGSTPIVSMHQRTGGATNAERWRLNENGRMLVSPTGTYGGAAGVGDLSSSSSEHVLQGQANGTTVAVIGESTGSSVRNLLSFLPSGSAGHHLTGRVDNVATVNIAANGNITNTNNSYGAISDFKLKQNIEDASPRLNDLLQLRVVTYELKSAPGKKLLGMVAQEVQGVMPGIVESTPDMHTVVKTRSVEIPAEFDDEGTLVSDATTHEEQYEEEEPTGEVTLSIKYSVLVPMLVQGLQEQQTIIDALKSRLDALEAQS